MTLENLVVYGGIVLGIWLIGVLTSLATAHGHRPVLRLGMRGGAQENRYASERASWRRLRHAFGHR
ncbi:MAG TPA: hypothetical protein VFG59_10830 [Anaeromyxobacter sp.]|nr:hypothetical protein [Anaeromyxobacter sp.]